MVFDVCLYVPKEKPLFLCDMYDSSGGEER